MAFKTTRCSHKGQTKYFHIVNKSDTVENAPPETMAAIQEFPGILRQRRCGQ